MAEQKVAAYHSLMLNKIEMLKLQKEFYAFRTVVQAYDSSGNDLSIETAKNILAMFHLLDQKFGIAMENVERREKRLEDCLESELRDYYKGEFEFETPAAKIVIKNEVNGDETPSDSVHTTPVFGNVARKLKF